MQPYGIYLPYAFTEHSAIMVATILKSSRAVEMSVYVVRAFVKLRELLSSNRELARRFAQLETRLDKRLTEHDQQIAAILSAIRQLMHSPAPKRRPIGFTTDLDEKSGCVGLDAVSYRSGVFRFLAANWRIFSRKRSNACSSGWPLSSPVTARSPWTLTTDR